MSDPYRCPGPRLVRSITTWDGVVWTALPATFNGAASSPNLEQVIAYLSGLKGNVRILAERYIRFGGIVTVG